MSPAKSPASKTAVTSAAGPTSVPVPAEAVGIHLPGVQLAQRPRHRGDGFGWPANAAPGKPEGEVDTRP
jgi:hypothetical protein